MHAAGVRRARRVGAVHLVATFDRRSPLHPDLGEAGDGGALVRRRDAVGHEDTWRRCARGRHAEHSKLQPLPAVDGDGSAAALKVSQWPDEGKVVQDGIEHGVGSQLLRTSC